MSISASFRLVLPFRQNNQFLPLARTYAKTTTTAVPGIAALGAKKKIGKGGPALEKKVIPVESDPHKLVNYVCGSCVTETGEDVQVKSDEEYPDWLWDLRTTKPPPLSEIEYDSLEYWKRVVKEGRKQRNLEKRNRRF